MYKCRATKAYEELGVTNKTGKDRREFSSRYEGCVHFISRIKLNS